MQNWNLSQPIKIEPIVSDYKPKPQMPLLEVVLSLDHSQQKFIEDNIELFEADEALMP